MNETPANSFEAFQLRSELQAVLLAAIGLARQELLFYDPDYTGWPMNDANMLAAIDQFLTSNRAAKLRLAARSNQHLLRDCPRLVSLLSRHSDRVQSACPTDVLALPAESLLIADSMHAMRLPDSSRPRGVFRRNDSGYALILRNRFDEIWQHCDARINVNPLGI
ncbi:hypothetical protein [Derxia gummosa]|uniref:DUF7931 domain-containing protein n=1 Tax=Derxia gummosa DSM 723 TaxID=1121388 RepID=A0A8B6XAT5_9BURK|nr:hypothetical protein [Derxia gummosa]